MKGARLLALGLLAALVACGHDKPGENYGNLLESPGGPVLLQEEHRPGWGRKDCFSCHLEKNLHWPTPDTPAGVDLEQIRALVRQGGEGSCAACHGANGN